MKKYLLLLVLALTVNFAFAQITATPLEVTEFEDGYLGPDDKAGHATMTNNDGTEKTFIWDLVELCNPTDFPVQFCTKDGCAVDGTVQGTVILAGGESSVMDLHIIAGTSTSPVEATVTITEDGNADNTVTVHYILNACITSTEEIAAAQSITLFPNPTADQFTLTENTVVESVRVYNILGGMVKSYEANINGTYDVADLNTGIYLVQLLGDENEVLRTMKMNKL